MRRRVALKILSPAVSWNARAQELFLREVQSAGKVFHPNIVTALEVGEQAGTYYFVMELIEGSSAADFVKSRGAFNWPEATRVVAEVCRGLEAAHQSGLIHRDIKPANIMRARDGTVKLADFGLAKPADAVEQNLTQMGAIIGTPNFMSPEQCAGEPLDDLHGNVWEYCSDWYADLPKSGLLNPNGRATGTQRVIRGGGWDSSETECAAGSRRPWNPANRAANIGFRVVCEQPSGR